MCDIVNINGTPYIPPLATLGDTVNPEIRKILDDITKQQHLFSFIMVGLRYQDGDNNTYILFNESILKDTAIAMAEEIRSQVTDIYSQSHIYTDEELEDESE